LLFAKSLVANLSTRAPIEIAPIFRLVRSQIAHHIMDTAATAKYNSYKAFTGGPTPDGLGHEAIAKPAYLRP